jgi:hypothetical protein
VSAGRDPTKRGPIMVLRVAFGFVQAIMGLFGAGSLIFAAHSLFLRYYQNEWIGIQYAGVNGCQGEDMVANGDLIGGQTFCNRPENFVPWTLIYRHHPLAAATYYGAAAAVIVLIGFVWSRLQRSHATTTPFGIAPPSIELTHHEHLR